MKIKNTYKLIILLLLTLSKSWSQNEATSLLPNVVPPSPSAYVLGNYGNVPMGLVNGTSNIEVPLMTFATKNLSIPINLFYGSNGIKVDDLSSSVGLGWNMNAGGIITRSANDVADEKDSTLPGSIPDDATLDDGILTSADIAYFYEIGNSPTADSERDIFSFNFNNISGKFVLDKNKNPVLIENQNVKIEKITESGKITFIATTNNGVKYYFSDIETTMFRLQNAGFSQPEIYTTSWYLTKITHPLGDEIYFEYENNDYSFTASESQSLIVSNPYNQENCVENGSNYQYGPVLTNITSHTMSINGRHIIKIYSNNTINGAVNFLYNTDNDPDVTVGNKKIKEIQFVGRFSEIIEKINLNYTAYSNKRTFLNQITFKDTAKSYNFEYISPDLFPQRLSKSQDIWGYYNGKSNSTLVPGVPNIPDLQFTKANKEADENFTKIGMLKKICYPTKGCSEFEYEANTFRGQKTITPAATAGYLNVYIGPTTTDPSAIKVSEETIYLPFAQIVQVGGYGEFNLDACDASLNTDHSQASLSVTCIETNSLMDLYGKAQNGNLFYYGASIILKENISVSTLYFYGEAGKHYKISLKASVRCTAGGANFVYYNSRPYTIEDNIVTGGIRVKSVKDITEAGPANYKRFLYSSLSSLNVSSGISSGSPYYISKSIKRIRCNGTGQTGVSCLYVDVTNLVLSSSSVLSLYDKGANVFYENVTVSYGDDAFLNGGETHQFIINSDLPGEVLLGSDFNHPSKTNSGWNNGLERKVIYFKKNNSAGNNFLYLKESINDYILDQRINKEVYSYSARKNFELDCFTSGQPNSIENLDIMRSVTSSHWNYLSSNQTKDYFYDSGNILIGSVINETKYFYDNPIHVQLSRKQNINSKNETLEAKYFYPPDLTGETWMPELTSANRTADPVITENYSGGTLISKSKTVFGKDVSTSSLLLPKEIYLAKFPNALPSLAGIGNLEKKITYSQYDDKGSIQQYIPESGIPVSIIWGYNKTQPIAKIENATNAQVAAALGVSDLNTINETNLSAINSLRTNPSMSNTMITTYTYLPLVGVSTITDPRGDTITYTYDALGRLEFVKDKDNNILSENQYNYKQ